MARTALLFCAPAGNTTAQHSNHTGSQCNNSRTQLRIGIRRAYFNLSNFMLEWIEKSLYRNVQ